MNKIAVDTNITVAMTGFSRRLIGPDYSRNWRQPPDTHVYWVSNETFSWLAGGCFGGRTLVEITVGVLGVVWSIYCQCALDGAVGQLFDGI